MKPSRFMVGVLAAVAVFIVGCATDRGYEAAQQGDWQTAIAIWTQEARNGNPTAIYNLGVASEHGAGVPQDREQALRLYTLAAQMGNSDARLRLVQLGAPVPEVKRANIDPNVLLMLMMMQNQQQQQQQYRPVVPTYRPPPTYNTNCTRDYFGNVSCTTTQH